MPGERRWKRTVQLGGEEFQVEFCERPFREGLEVSTVVDGNPIHLAELGLGERAALERLMAEIARLRANLSIP